MIFCIVKRTISVAEILIVAKIWNLIMITEMHFEIEIKGYNPISVQLIKIIIFL